MITYVEGVLTMDQEGFPCVTRPDGSDTTRIPSLMHPLAARGAGRYDDLLRHAIGGAYVTLTIENAPRPSILEIDEIRPATPMEIAQARMAIEACTRRVA